MTRRPHIALRVLALAGALAVVTATPASAASEWDLDTTPDVTTAIWPFGTPHTATYGQTITVPAGVATIESFSFLMEVPAAAVFRGAVQEWDPATLTATGPVLYLSDPRSTSGPARETVTFTPDVAITAGTYLIYATTSYDWTEATAQGTWPMAATNPYPGGTFVFNNNDDDEGALTGTAWSEVMAYDAAFTVVFTAAPVVPPVVPPVSPPATPAITPPAYTG